MYIMDNPKNETWKVIELINKMLNEPNIGKEKKESVKVEDKKGKWVLVEKEAEKFF